METTKMQDQVMSVFDTLMSTDPDTIVSIAFSLVTEEDGVLKSVVVAEDEEGTDDAATIQTYLMAKLFLHSMRRSPLDKGLCSQFEALVGTFVRAMEGVTEKDRKKAYDH